MNIDFDFIFTMLIAAIIGWCLGRLDRYFSERHDQRDRKED